MRSERKRDLPSRSRSTLKTVAFWVFAIAALFIARGQSQESIDERSLRTAKQVVEAIVRHDTAYLASVADLPHVSLGFDEDPMSTAQFRQDLKQRKGVYCVFFRDRQRCKSQPGKTLEELIRDSQPVRFKVMGADGEKYARGVAVYSKAESKTELFTLWFRCKSAHCRLNYVEYL